MKAGRKRTNGDAESMAKRVRELRAQKLTQREIAERVGLERTTVQYYLRDNNKASFRAGLIT